MESLFFQLFDEELHSIQFVVLCPRHCRLQLRIGCTISVSALRTMVVWRDWRIPDLVCVHASRPRAVEVYPETMSAGQANTKGDGTCVPFFSFIGSRVHR